MVRQLTPSRAANTAADPGPRMTASAASDLLLAAGVMPVVTVEDTTSAVGIAQALAEGGLFAMEVTLRSAVAFKAIGAIRREVPAMTVGAGTVLDARQLRAAQDAGALFVATLGTPVSLADALARASVPVIPGAATASEMMTLVERGFDALKLFPVEPLGGLSIVSAIAGPLPHVGLYPTGGIVEVQLPDYLAQPNVLCVGGSWLVRHESIAGGDYGSVRDAAQRARAYVDANRPAQ